MSAREDLIFKYINDTIIWLDSDQVINNEHLLCQIERTMELLHGRNALSNLDKSALVMISGFDDEIGNAQKLFAGIEMEFNCFAKPQQIADRNFYENIRNACKQKIPEFDKLQLKALHERDSDYGELRTTKQTGFLRSLLVIKLLELSVRTEIGQRNSPDLGFTRMSSNVHYSILAESKEEDGDVSEQYNQAVLKLARLLLPMLCAPEEAELIITKRYIPFRIEVAKLDKIALKKEVDGGYRSSLPYGKQRNVAQFFLRECYTPQWRDGLMVDVEFNREFRKGPRGFTHFIINDEHFERYGRSFGYDPEIAQVLVVAAAIANKVKIENAVIPKFLQKLTHIYNKNDDGYYCLKTETQKQRMQAMRDSALLREVFGYGFVSSMSNTIDALHNRGRHSVELVC